MYKGRKLATEKQINYANSIAKALSIMVYFPDESSFYDVSMFIKENETAYKNNLKTKLASQRQIDYANAISDACEINKHFHELSLYKEVDNFIRDHVDEYKRIIWRSEIIEDSASYENSIIDKKSLLFACDNLYKKHGLYAFIGDDGRILYIGKSSDLSQRIVTSYSERKRQAKICDIMYYTLDNMSDVNVLEILLICENKPLLNSESKTNDIPTMFHSDINILADFNKLPVKEIGEE